MATKEDYGLLSPTEEKKVSISSKALYIGSLTFSTIVLLGVYITSGLSTAGDPEKFGFKNKTGDISDEYYTQITPAGWAFSIWGIIYAWQALWTVYGWSLVVRHSFPLTITPVSVLFYSCANIGNIAWIYVWGNAYPQYAFPILVIIGVLLYSTIIFQAVYLYRQTELLKSLQRFKIDLYLVRIVVINGFVIYATWVSIATLINFTIVLQYYADMAPENAGTIALSLLTVEVIVYFILENTILDRFTRPIVMVYPVVIWALSAALDAHWGNEDDDRNSIFTLVLLVLSVILFMTRIILIIVFAFVRAIPYPNKTIV